MRDGFLKMSAIATAVVSYAVCFPAIAADPIYDAESPRVVRHYREQRPVRTAYVRTTGLECGDLLIKYRRPYEPHSEIVQICHPPIYVDTRVAY